MLKLTMQNMTSLNYFLILSNNMNTARICLVGRTPPPPFSKKKTTENIRYTNYSIQTNKLMVNQLVGYVQMMNMQYFAVYTQSLELVFWAAPRYLSMFSYPPGLPL